MGLVVYRVGNYGSWKSLGCVLPEFYLVLLLATRGFVNPLSEWSAILQLHSAALYVVRWCCALIAATYSMYWRPGVLSFVLGTARVVFLTSMVLAQPLRVFQ
jgi:hypothetical protein